jgi:integrase
MGRATVYNNIVTEDLWAKVNEENKILIKDFIDYKRSSDKSPNTLYQYESILRIFFVWNLQNNGNKFFVDMKKREFIRFFNYLVTDLKSSPNRISMVKSTLSSLSNYIEDILDDDYPEFRNIVTKIEIATKTPVRVKTVLTEEQVNTCLEKLVAEGKYQVACFFALATASGARKAELLRFKCDYFKDENIVFGCMYKTPEEVKTKGRGSRGKMLYKYTFVKQFKPYFEKWMEERKRLGIDSEWLFVVKDTNGEYKKAETSITDNWGKAVEKCMGNGTPFYWHSCRHYWTTNLKRKNLPDAVIAELQGWQSAGEMIALYSDLDITEVLDKYFDENGVREDIQSGKLTDV